MPGNQTLLFRIYQILTEYTDGDHPLRQQDIIDMLEKNYGMKCERQAVARNISYLLSCDVDIQQIPRNGYYYAGREFDDTELRLLMDSVLGNKHVTNRQTKDIMKKLAQLGGKNFENKMSKVTATVNSSKTPMSDIFNNIDQIDRAIQEGVQISFIYNQYDLNKQLKQRNTHIVSPYNMVMHSQHYYLVSHDEDMNDKRIFRIDKMSKIGLLKDPVIEFRSLPDYKEYNYEKVVGAHPYLFADKPVEVVFKAKLLNKGRETYIMDAIMDWLGNDVEIINSNDTEITAKISTSKYAMEYWALQYSKCVEIIEPVNLRNTVIEDIKNASRAYGITE